MRAELQTVLDSVQRLALEQLPELLGELETIRATALLKMAAPVPPVQPHDVLLDVESAAERMGVSTDYLYRHARQLQFTRRMGRKLLFSELGLDAYIRQKGNNAVLTARQQQRIVSLSR